MRSSLHQREARSVASRRADPVLAPPPTHKSQQPRSFACCALRVLAAPCQPLPSAHGKANPDEIERTVGVGNMVIRNNPAEAQKIYEAQFARNGISPLWENQPVGSVDQIVEQLAPYVKLGYKHLIAGFSTPHDEESLIRFAEEVKPQLETI